MTKNFFVIVPYSAEAVSSKEGVVERLFDTHRKKEDSKKKEDLANFEEKRSQLDERVGIIIESLGQCGVQSAQLGTEEIIELFYKTFNPGDISQGIKLE